MLLALAMVGVGCTASSEDVRPPPDQFSFPTGLAIDPAQSKLFVVNANSELRYDSGSINVLNLDMIDGVTALTPGCAPDPAQLETLVCDDEGRFFVADAGVRIGNFASGVSVQTISSTELRFIIPVRGDPSITWVKWDGSKLSCDDDSSQNFELCDDVHRLTTVTTADNNPDNDDNDDIEIPLEPFRSYVDSAGQYAVVTHLDSGRVTLVNSPIGRIPEVTDVIPTTFQPGNSFTPGGTAVAGRRPGTTNDLLYVASRTEDRIQMLTVEIPQPVEEDPQPAPFLVPSGYFFLNAAGSNIGGSSDSRGLAFTADGNRLLVVNRRPPTLQIYDSSDNEAGVPKNQTVAVHDICRNASGLTVGEGVAGSGQLALVSCFNDGTVQILDATGLRGTLAVISVGRGPYEIVVSSTRQKAYVSNFLEDSIGVIDLTPGPTQFREILRIGKARPL
jgi:DNA-binding beta-propeller fold protein YncE